ncbi:18478_t:CDS:1, partial [Racocetra fulgida]
QNSSTNPTTNLTTTEIENINVDLLLKEERFEESMKIDIEAISIYTSDG